MRPVLSTLSYTGKKERKKEQELCFPLSHSSALQLTSHVVYQPPHTYCLHLPLHPGSGTLLRASQQVTPTHDSLLEPLNCHMCHYPNPESQPHSSLPDSISPYFKTLFSTPILQETSQQDLWCTHKSRGWRKEAGTHVKKDIKTLIKKTFKQIRLGSYI